MTENKSSTQKPQNSPPPSTSSDFEKGFAPAGSADQGTNVQFTPAGQVTPAKTENSEKGESGKK